MATVSETIQVRGIRCERCMARLAHVLKDHPGLDSANATLTGEVRSPTTTSRPRARRCSATCAAAASRVASAPP